jgi:hypothetical protein
MTCNNAMVHSRRYSSFFLQSTDGPEYSRTNCQQMDSHNPRCIGWFWNFANASARNYYVEKVVMPLAVATTIDGSLAHRPLPGL